MTPKSPEDRFDALLDEVESEPPVPTRLHASIMGSLETEWGREDRRKRVRLWWTMAGLAAAAIFVLMILPREQVAPLAAGPPSLPLAIVHLEIKWPELSVPIAYRQTAQSLTRAATSPTSSPAGLSFQLPSLRLPTGSLLDAAAPGSGDPA